MLILQRMFAALAAVTMAAFLAACGGGDGAGAQGTTGSGGGGTGAAALDLKTSEPSIGSDGKRNAMITAYVKDSSGRALANQQVDFSLADQRMTSGPSGATLINVVPRTDARGTASAELTISDKWNGSIVVNASAGGQSRAVTVEVVGTTITVNGPTTLIANVPTEYTIGLRDSSGAVIASQAIEVSSSTGNSISQAKVTTNSAGQAKVVVTGTKQGADTLTASALSAQATTQLQVSSTQLVFSAPAEADVKVTEQKQVVVTYSVGGVPQGGSTIQFATTRGTLSATSAVTNANGDASVSIGSSTAGIATITAIAAAGTASQVVSTRRVEFVSTTPAKLTLQASPAIVGVNLSASGTKSSQIIAIVRDGADNPVKGQTVAFSALVDPSNGRIEPSVATTDSSGVASVAFFPGANSSGNGGVEIQGRIPGTNVAGSTKLTASRQELSARVGTGNLIEEYNISAYKMPWTVVVTDASGNPVPNAQVQVSLVGTAFRKGFWIKSGPVWVPVTVESCVGEDFNGNGRLDAGEDINSDAELTPGTNATSSVEAPGVTDASGVAQISVIYPKEYAVWTDMRLQVTITAIAGTENVSTRSFTLPVMGVDTTKDFPPPGQPSPFGREPGCDNRN